MIFWDASAIVPLLVAGITTPQMQARAERDPDILVWWGSRVECMSALARLERAAALDAKRMARAADRLKQLADGWHEIEPSEIVRETAVRFLRVHPLRAADAFQLAAAFIPIRVEFDSSRKAGLRPRAPPGGAPPSLISQSQGRLRALLKEGVLF